MTVSCYRVPHLVKPSQTCINKIQHGGRIPHSPLLQTLTFISLCEITMSACVCALPPLSQPGPLGIIGFFVATPLTFPHVLNAPQCLQTHVNIWRGRNIYISSNLNPFVDRTISLLPDFRFPLLETSSLVNSISPCSKVKRTKNCHYVTNLHKVYLHKIDI